MWPGHTLATELRGLLFMTTKLNIIIIYESENSFIYR